MDRKRPKITHSGISLTIFFIDAWDEYIKPIPENERDNFIAAYHKRLTGDNEEEKIKCAKAWSTWECSTSKLYVDPVEIAKASEDIWALAFARIECHYFFNKGFFKTDAHILENMDKIRHIPATIVQVKKANLARIMKDRKKETF